LLHLPENVRLAGVEPASSVHAGHRDLGSGSLPFFLPDPITAPSGGAFWSWSIVDQIDSHVRRKPDLDIVVVQVRAFIDFDALSILNHIAWITAFFSVCITAIWQREEVSQSQIADKLSLCHCFRSFRISVLA
jgi:hypothetical protein